MPTYHDSKADLPPLWQNEQKKRVLFFILGNQNYCTAEGVRNKSRWEQILCLPSFRQHVACRCPWLEESCQKVRKISLEKKSAAVLTHPSVGKPVQVLG